MKRTLQEEVERIQQITYGKTIVLEASLWDMITGKKQDDKLADKVEPDVQDFYTSLETAAKTGLNQKQAGQMDYQKEVETMQIGLELLGYELPQYGVDGKFGPETAATVQKFKQDNQILNEAAEDLRNTLDTLGYSEKGNELSSGGEISNDLSSIVSQILSDFKKTNPSVKVTVTGGNDKFHKGLGYKSKHTEGKAIDVTLNPYNQNTAGVFKKVLDKYTKGDFSYVDEYENPSGSATAGHFHLQMGAPAVSGGGATQNTNQANLIQATPEMLNKMILLLKEKNITVDDINKYTNVVVGSAGGNIEFNGTKDNDFYKAILTGLGAPITPENLKFLYAWRQSEGHGGLYNPFNTTLKKPGSTTFDKDGVQNYKTPSDGLSATIQTIAEPRYKCITDGLRQNIGADKLSACDCLDTWGTTKSLVSQVVAGYNAGHEPKIRTIMA
jgi:peptidoglycan hydrolase-like protein with peptidoglycan-binding domain